MGGLVMNMFSQPFCALCFRYLTFPEAKKHTHHAKAIVYKPPPKKQ